MMKLWQLKYIIGCAFLGSHLGASAIIWFLLRPNVLGEEDARTLFSLFSHLLRFILFHLLKTFLKISWLINFIKMHKLRLGLDFCKLGSYSFLQLHSCLSCSIFTLIDMILPTLRHDSEYLTQYLRASSEQYLRIYLALYKRKRRVIGIRF